MDDEQSLLAEPTPEPRASTAAEAFARLEAQVASLNGRVAMMTRALEHIAIERQSIEVPDYSSTLGKISSVLTDMGKRTKAMEDAPAMQMTPESMAERINKAAEGARRADDAAFRQWDKLLEAKVQRVETIIGTADTKDQQKTMLLTVGIASGVTAFLLGIFLPVLILRALPESWHKPESMAAWVMGEASLWHAGIRLMRAENPDGWDEIALAWKMRLDNREAIIECEQAAAKANRRVSCVIRVGSVQL